MKSLAKLPPVFRVLIALAASAAVWLMGQTSPRPEQLRSRVVMIAAPPSGPGECQEPTGTIALDGPGYLYMCVEQLDPESGPKKIWVRSYVPFDAAWDPRAYEESDKLRREILGRSLKRTSPYAGQASDGSDIGVDAYYLADNIDGVPDGRPPRYPILSRRPAPESVKFQPQ